MYKWLQIERPEDYKKIEPLLNKDYRAENVASKLMQGLSPAVKAILIEMQYADKDYRSTYYNFYSKKGRRYSPDCVRLNFFSEKVQFSEETLALSVPDGNLADHYFGYMVLRPTGIATIGRSVLSPNVRADAIGKAIGSMHTVHLLGHTLKVEGFPSMDQHSDISVCAHVACWSILRHYSEKWRTTREFLTYEITLMAQEFNPGGMTPARGLNILQAERVFQEAGLFPLVVTRPDRGSTDSFYQQMISYLDSGFPIFAAMHGRKHAVAVVGYNIRPMQSATVMARRHLWDEVESLTVVDDNHLPYLTIARDPGPSSPYSAQDIDAFIVALPDKIYYPADALAFAERNLQKSFSPVMAMPQPAETIVRYFITTANRLREHITLLMSELPDAARKTILQLPLSKFIWVVEYSSQTQWNNNYVSVRAVLDATAGPKEADAMWLVYGRNTMFVCDRTNLAAPGYMLETPGMESVPLLKMDNLKPIRV
jgi:hypothetical protein